jgi:GH25 family lysozyme M1 (1,4-beta-N-acetylmuramidase)
MNMLRKVTVLRRRCARNWRRAWAVAVAGSLAAAVSLAAAPMADAATASSAARPMRGIDISAYQHADGPINWRVLARQGIRFVAIKVTEGTYYKNPYYSADVRSAARAGLAVMPYVFANPDAAGGAATASFAIRAAHYGRGRAELPLVVDLENDPYSRSNCYWLNSRRTVAWIAAFTARTRALTGVRPIIYTTDDWWKECTRSTGRFRADALWLADYNAGSPRAPRSWRRWAFWQYTDEGFLTGIGWTDLDYYRPVTALPSLRPAARSKPRPKPKHKLKLKLKRQSKPKRRSSDKRRPKDKRQSKDKHRPNHLRKDKSKPEHRSKHPRKDARKDKHRPKPKHKRAATSKSVTNHQILAYSHHSGW